MNILFFLRDFIFKKTIFNIKLNKQRWKIYRNLYYLQFLLYFIYLFYKFIHYIVFTLRAIIEYIEESMFNIVFIALVV